ncbi:MAG: beta-lactamase domain protein, partial [Sedimentibacter sp.]|nr:beta-lactamase domain protein [Sedimentibacter sp.]
MNLIHVKGNTYCIEVGMSYIPFYKLNEKDIIMLDTGA